MGRLTPLKNTAGTTDTRAPTYDPFSSPSFRASMQNLSNPSKCKLDKIQRAAKWHSSVQMLSQTALAGRRRSVESEPGGVPRTIRRRKSVELEPGRQGRRKSINPNPFELEPAPVARRRPTSVDNLAESYSSLDGSSALKAEAGPDRAVVSNCPASFKTRKTSRTIPSVGAQRRGQLLQPLSGAVAGGTRARKRSVVSELPVRLTTQQKVAQQEEQQRKKEVGIAEAWERAFRGVERQMQYADSLCTATKLPDIGKWQEMGQGIIGNIAQLRAKMANLEEAAPAAEAAGEGVLEQATSVGQVGQICIPDLHSLEAAPEAASEAA